MNNSLYDEAKQLLNEGFCVLPCIAIKKHPEYSWKLFQKLRPNEQQLLNYFISNEDHDAICFLTGKISGNLEVIDFDLHGELYPKWAELVNKENPDLLKQLVIESTQNNGIHVAYRCESEINETLKLARRKIIINSKERIQTLIETRGEGGLILVAPSKGYNLIQGEYLKIPTITKEQRGFLLKCAFDLDEVGEVKEKKKEHKTDYQKDDYKISVIDDYNQRSDFSQLLTKHGWKYISKEGKNEKWTRPDKDLKTCSATFNGTIFYVFSSNAFPFEMNQGYSKFKAYSILEHNGDYKIARYECLKMGYGVERESIEESDIITIKEMEYEEEEIKHPIIPEELLNVGGFIGRVMNYSYDNAPVPNKVMSFVGALALQSYLCGRKVKGMNDTMPNLYLLGLGFSSTGKDFPRKVNSEILSLIGHGSDLGAKFASAEGIEDALFENPSMLFQTDEIDTFLEAIKSGKDQRYSLIMSYLMNLYSSSGSFLQKRSKSSFGNKSQNKPLAYPHLTIFGTAVPTYYYQSISQKMFNNGFFGRMLVFQSYKKEKFRFIDKRPIPQEIIEEAKFWRDLGNKGDNYFCNIWQAPYTEECKETLQCFAEKVHEIQVKFESKQDNGALTIWGRAIENVSKLALIRACSNDMYNIKITMDDVKWAIQIVEFLIASMMDGIKNNLVETLEQENAKKLKEILIENNGFLSRTDLKRKARFSKKIFDEAILELLDDGTIFKVEEKLGCAKVCTAFYKMKKIKEKK